MSTAREIRFRAAAGGRTVLSSLFALAFVAAVPCAALAQEAEEGKSRLLEIVPADAAGDSAAAEIADLAAGAANEAEAGEAAAAEQAAAVEEGADEQAAAGADAFAELGLDNAPSAIDIHRRLEEAGYEVKIVRREPANRYQILGKGADGLSDLLLHVDGDSGKVLSHEYVDAADYENSAPGHAGPASAGTGNPGHAYPAYRQTYRPVWNRSYYPAVRQYHPGGYGTGGWSGY